MRAASRYSTALFAVCFGSALHAQPLRRPLAVDRSSYIVTAGDRVPIPAPAESHAFMRSAKIKTAHATGRAIRNFALAPDAASDRILLGVPLTTDPGDYSVELTVASDTAEERTATIRLIVTPFAAPVASSIPPVVLLDGFQFGATGCPMSTDSSGTFGKLQTYLAGPPNSNPNIYFFENCTECPSCSIEQLGTDLGTFLNQLAVPQVDVVVHSMGGLIVRSYLSGKQAASGQFTPPSTQQIRKAVFIATPHFGSFQADSALSDLLFAGGVQNNEMKRGSRFLWDLATWNQFADDLRGVDAVSVVGNAGPSGQSDGVVYTTSGSLDFARPGHTRVVSYCHIPGSSSGGLAGLYTGCSASGIANVDSTSHPSYQIVSSFLLDTPAWSSVGISPAQDASLSKDGGMIVANINAGGQVVTGLSGVSFGSTALSNGAASGELFYKDFLSGTATINFGVSTCGPFSETPGVYSAVRCKSGPWIASIGPLLPGVAKIVQAGNTITVNGSGFGAQQCATCMVTAPASLQISSWSDTSIAALLPSTSGFKTLVVTTENGSDAVNIIVGSVATSTLTLSATSLNFAFAVGGAPPPVKSVTVTGPSSFAATTNAPWLNAGVSGASIAVSINPSGLAAGTYQGTVSVSAAGASNSPQTVSVSLVVSGGSPASIVITSVTHAATNLTGPIAPGELIAIYGTGLGPAAGTSFSVNPSSGMVDTALAGTRVFFGSITAPVTYASATQINVIAPYEIADQSQVTIQAQYQGSFSSGQNIQVVPASPGAFTANSSGSGPAIAANQDGTLNSASNPAAKGAYVTLYLTGGGQTNPVGITGSVNGLVLKYLTQSISVTVGNQPATVSFAGAAPTLVDGVDQINIQLSPATPSGPQPLVITMNGASSPSSVLLAVQ